MTADSPKIGDRRQCRYGTRSGGPCGMEIELRQGPNPGLPPGWYEIASGAPHTCRSVCPSCHRRIGGPDRHALGCDRYAALVAYRDDLTSRQGLR